MGLPARPAPGAATLGFAWDMAIFSGIAGVNRARLLVYHGKPVWSIYTFSPLLVVPLEARAAAFIRVRFAFVLPAWHACNGERAVNMFQRWHKMHGFVSLYKCTENTELWYRCTKIHGVHTHLLKKCRIFIIPEVKIQAAQYDLGLQNTAV